MNALTPGKVIACLALVFIAGGSAGAFLTLKNTRPRETQPASVEKACHRLQDRFVSRLQLTPEQVKKLQPVFDETAMQLRSAHARAMQEGDAIIRKAQTQIAAELTPEQKVKLDQFDKERCDWMRRRLKDGEVAKPTP